MDSADRAHDGINQYLFDAENRICAVESQPLPTLTIMTGYIYDASGERVSKGNISAWSCDPTISHFAATSDFILGPAGDQVTEMGMDTTGMAWQHTNVYAAGKLLATYYQGGLHFYLNDPLGTRRTGEGLNRAPAQWFFVEGAPHLKGRCGAPAFV